MADHFRMPRGLPKGIRDGIPDMRQLFTKPPTPRNTTQLPQGLLKKRKADSSREEDQPWRKDGNLRRLVGGEARTKQQFPREKDVERGRDRIDRLQGAEPFLFLSEPSQSSSTELTSDYAHLTAAEELSPELAISPFSSSQHRSLAESSQSDDRQSKKHPATFQCHLCPKRFTRVYNLRSHLRTHTDGRPFVCTVCGKAFSHQDNCNRHKLLHSAEKKFVCRGELIQGGHWGCGRRFAGADALGRHFRSQAGRICIKPLLDEESQARSRSLMDQQQQHLQAIPQPLIVPGMDGQHAGGFVLPVALLAQYPALRDFSALEDDSSSQDGAQSRTKEPSLPADNPRDFIRIIHREKRRVQRTDLESAYRPDRPYYTSSVASDGKYHCPYNSGEKPCGHPPTTERVIYESFLNIHLNPYYCRVLACVEASVRFPSEADLIRHQHDAHSYLCTLDRCSRSLPGNGFASQLELLGHMREAHAYTALELERDLDIARKRRRDKRENPPEYPTPRDPDHHRMDKFAPQRPTFNPTEVPPSREERSGKAKGIRSNKTPLGVDECVREPRLCVKATISEDLSAGFDADRLQKIRIRQARSNRGLVAFRQGRNFKHSHPKMHRA